MALAFSQSGRKLPQRLSSAWTQLIRLHDKSFSDAGRVALKHFIVRASVVSFAIHLGLIFTARCLPAVQPLADVAGTNYLAAIATPFNFILFYEVMTLIAALPVSTTRSIANQFEIVSLIFIRDVFRDFSAAGKPGWVEHDPKAVLPLAFDMASGLLMFLLATVFQRFAQRQIQMPRTPGLIAGREKFMAQKKVVAVALTVLLLVLAAYHIARFVVDVWQESNRHPVAMESVGYFYNDLFTVMIFTDVLVLILSLVVSGRFEMVFRNAAFVISIIVIRFSLTEERPYGAIIALSAMVFGILTLAIFNYHSWVRALGMQTLPDDH